MPSRNRTIVLGVWGYKNHNRFSALKTDYILVKVAMLHSANMVTSHVCSVTNHYELITKLAGKYS